MDAGEDVMFLAVMWENQQQGSNTASQSDLQSWANQYSLDYPVVADPGGSATNGWMLEGFPTYPAIGYDMTIVDMDLYPFNCPEVQGHL